jgi:plastocyanin
MLPMNTRKNFNFVLISSIVTAIVLVSTSAITNVNATANTTTITGVSVVKAGGGNATAPLTSFTPQQMEIKVGQSVMWYNPTLVGEPHTVSFVLDNKSNTDFAIPFAVPSSTKFMVLPPGSNGQPTVGGPPTNGMNTIIGINGRVYNPVAIDSSGNVKVMSQDANYTMAGSEKYVNSGLLLPKGKGQEFPGSSTTFTVTFEKAGIYYYHCILHDWMKGKVIVK